MSFSAETYALSKKFTNDSISGISGALAGKNCTIQSITEIEGGHRVTFQWTADNGTVRTQTMDVMDGSGAEAIEQIYADNGLLGAKNLLENTASTQTVNGVTFTVNPDKSISLSGTASGTTFYTIGPLENFAEIGTNLKLTGCPTGGSASDGISISIRTNSLKNVRYNNIDILDIGNGFTFDASAQLTDSDGNNVTITDLILVARVGGSVNTTGKVLYPMIRLATDTDSTYQPYAMTNRELTEVKVFDENSAGFSVSNATIHWAKSCMKKCGNVCMFTFMVTTTGAISQYDNIVKLPTEMRPQSFTRLQVQSILNCVMDESGSIYAAEAIESGITAYLSGTYIM